MISTAITTSRGIALGTSSEAAGCRARTAAAVVNPAFKAALGTSVDYRITAQQHVSSFVEGPVWMRPTTLDVLVPTTPGHLAWSPPT
jgi:hypothetical protein